MAKSGVPKKRSRPSHKSVELGGKIVLEDGKMKAQLNSPAYYAHFIKTYCKVGDHFSMKITNRRPKRSSEQNSFFHVYLSLIALSTGHTVAELKDWVREHILAKGVTEVFGDTVKKTKSTTDLNISEFMEMMNEIEEKTEIPIPDPEPFNIPLLRDEYNHLKMEQTAKYSKMEAKQLKIKKPKK